MRDQFEVDPLLQRRPDDEKSSRMEAIPFDTKTPLSVNHGVNLALLRRFLKILWKMKIYHPLQIIMVVLIIAAWTVVSVVASFAIAFPGLFAMSIAKSDWFGALIYLGLLGGTSLTYVVMNSIITLLYGLMKWNWRWNLTECMIKAYLKNKNYYDLLYFRESSVDNPDQRITADVLQFVEKMVFVLDILIQHSCKIALSVTFLILQGSHWSVFVFPVVMPIIMILGNLILSLPITMTLYRKNEAEGTFRYYHARIREHAETMCFFGGEKTERSHVAKIFDRLIKFSYYLLFFSFGLLIWGYCISYLPVVSCLFIIGMMAYWSIPPFTPDMTPATISLITKELFDRMNMVSLSVIMLLNVGPDLGIIFGNIHRIGVFFEACENLTKKSAPNFKIEKKKRVEEKKRLVDSPAIASRGEKPSGPKILQNENKISFQDVDIITPNGAELYSKLSFEVKEGEDLLIMGPSGSGKSSILRILSGLWDLKNNEAIVEKPTILGRNGLFYMPQKPYLIKGDLKMQILYPYSERDLLKNPKYNEKVEKNVKNPSILKDSEIIELLELANLKYLMNHINKAEAPNKNSKKSQKPVDASNSVFTNVKIQWEKELSLGEIQRLAFVRLFFHRPKFAILDEATSALDQENEENLHKVCHQLGITLLSVAHRPSCKAHHKNLLQLSSNGDWQLRQITDQEKKKARVVHWKVIAENKETESKLKSMNLMNENAKDSFVYVFKEENDEKKPKKATGLFKKSFLRHFVNVFSSLFFDFKGNSCMGIIFKVWLPLLIIMLVAVFVGTLQLFATTILPYSMIPWLQARTPWFFAVFLIVATLMLSFAFLDGVRVTYNGFVGIMTRARLTRKLHKNYFDSKIYYKASHLDQEIDNVDQRISVDSATLAGFEEPGLIYIFATFCYKTTTSLVNIIYTTILFPFAPIMTVIFVTIFASAQIILMAFITNATFNQEKKEGYFRFSLARLKEYAEQIALYNGIEAESVLILDNFRKVMYSQLGLIVKEWFLQVYQYCLQAAGQYVAILLLFIMGPLLVQIGGLTPENAIQILMTFLVAITTSLFSLLDITKLSLDLAKNFGALNRVGQLMEHMKALRKEFESKPGTVDFKETEENEICKDSLKIEKLTVRTPSGERKLLENLNLELKYGQNLLINGRSGCGKSSLLRVIGQLWPTNDGKITFFVENLKETDINSSFGEKMQKYGYFFVPQKPYCVLGSFREMVTYPDKTSNKTDGELLAILNSVKLSHIFQRIDRNWGLVKDWATFFSPGEQQRISFARILYQNPKFVILDEATASLDLENEEIMYNLCKTHGISCISVGHRETLNEYHDLLLSYEEFEGWTLKMKEESTPM